MKNVFVSLILVSTFSVNFIDGMQKVACKEVLVQSIKHATAHRSKYAYRQATMDDAKGLLDLINTEAIKASESIVIMPEKFRAEALEKGIKAGRLFVAYDGTKVIGYKKLFCITDKEELDAILADELCCIGKGAKLVAAGSVALDRLALLDASKEAEHVTSSPATYIYNGADFTHPDYRGGGVNSELTAQALEAVLKITAAQMESQKSSRIVMVYGITQGKNAGKEEDLLGGRTRSIMQQFIPFVATVAKALQCVAPATLQLSRYSAYKPSFDPKATELRPLGKEASIPGYGCLIVGDVVPTKELS